MPQLLDDDRTLFNLLAKGDRDAFKDLYNKYFPRLSAYIFKICKSVRLTEDVLQEVFLKLWENREKCQEVEVPEAFILFIAKNTTIDWLRKISRQTTLVVDLATEIRTARNDAESKLSLESLESIISNALSQLSDQKQKVFKLSKVNGLSHDEIASELELSKSTIKNHLSETLKHIRKQINPTVSSEVLMFLVLLHSI